MVDEESGRKETSGRGKARWLGQHSQGQSLQDDQAGLPFDGGRRWAGHTFRSWGALASLGQRIRARPALALTANLVISLSVVFLIGLLISLTGGLPNAYVNLYFLLVVYVALTMAMPWPLLVAGLAGLIPSPQGLLNVEALSETPEAALLRLLVFLVAAALVSASARWIRGQHLAQAGLLQVQQALTQRLFNAQEEERRRLAFDIHDGLGQIIVAAGMHMEAYRSERKGSESAAVEEELTKAASYLQSAVTEARRIVSELRPVLLDDFGLAQALKHYLEDMAGRLGWEASFVESLGDARLQPFEETVLFRIAQEALTNAHKHARANKVEVRLLRQGDDLSLEVKDWGVGFDVERAFTKGMEGGHVGLASMRERAQLLRGEFRCLSAPDEGTTISVSLAVRDKLKIPKSDVVEMAQNEEPAIHMPNKGGITVLIVDDHPMVREGLRSMLNVKDVRVVGEAANGNEAVEQVRRLRPDVALMDVRMPDMDGLAATEIVKGELPTTSVIIVTSYESKDYLRRAIAVGAAGYLLKGMSRETLVDAIKVVRGGGSLIESSLLAELLHDMGIEGPRIEESAGLLEALSPRERQVLQLLVQGLTNKEIAAQMHYSQGTVKNVVQRLIGKLGVSDRTQAAVLAVRAGMPTSEFPSG
ncbi:MAG: response regulator [Dehalococcoidia bacterium]